MKREGPPAATRPISRAAAPLRPGWRVSQRIVPRLRWHARPHRPRGSLRRTAHPVDLPPAPPPSPDAGSVFAGGAGLVRAGALRTTARLYGPPRLTPESTPIFRGVPRGHPGYDDAVRGRASPRDPRGRATPVEHNENLTDRSPYTSWTHDRALAAGRARADGVVLEWRTGPPPSWARWSFEWSPDIYLEKEVLIRGPIRGAKVTRP